MRIGTRASARAEAEAAKGRLHGETISLIPQFGLVLRRGRARL
eukprot:SAG11_NODE_23737_length_384_cov_0.449123_1_plen_42_part_10